MPEIQPPAGLEASGTKLWTAVTEVYSLTPGELSTLEQAARTADELDRLERKIRALPDLVVPGSMGQPRMHPILAEAREHRRLLERLTTALALPNVDQDQGFTAAQRHARRAAVARWQGKADDGSMAS